jgi:DNA-directed RNA polymerase specialized sigma54-like protein
VRPSRNPRYIPAHVKRAVWERDGGQCTFVSETGRRCQERKRLEFDHVEEVARGGRASVNGIRLRCRAHNQYGAECTFGAGFMREKCEAARRAAEARRQQGAARAEVRARARSAAEEVIAPLRSLGFRAEEARQAAALCEAIPEASLEQRVRRALTYFHPPRTCAQPTASLGSPP